MSAVPWRPGFFAMWPIGPLPCRTGMLTCLPFFPSPHLQLPPPAEPVGSVLLCSLCLPSCCECVERGICIFRADRLASHAPAIWVVRGERAARLPRTSARPGGGHGVPPAAAHVAGTPRAARIRGVPRGVGARDGGVPCPLPPCCRRRAPVHGGGLRFWRGGYQRSGDGPRQSGTAGAAGAWAVSRVWKAHCPSAVLWASTVLQLIRPVPHDAAAPPHLRPGIFQVQHAARHCRGPSFPDAPQRPPLSLLFRCPSPHQRVFPTSIAHTARSNPPLTHFALSAPPSSLRPLQQIPLFSGTSATWQHVLVGPCLLAPFPLFPVPVPFDSSALPPRDTVRPPSSACCTAC